MEVPGAQEDTDNQAGVGPDVAVYGQPSDPDAERLDTGRQPASGIPSLLCACGCGGLLGEPRGRYQKRYLAGHWQRMRRARTGEQWRAAYDALWANAPLCGCGCGGHVKPVCSTLERFIRGGGNRKYSRFLYGHDKRPVGWDIVLSAQERGALLGTLLGDSVLQYPNRRSRNPRLVCRHSPAQQEWIDHKARFLHRLTPRLSETANGGWGDRIITLHTRCLPCLAGLYDLCHSGGRRQVTREWLDELGVWGLAWWIGDDGSSSRGNFILCTHSESLAEVEIIQKWLVDTYGPANLRTERKADGRVFHALYFTRELRNSLWPLVQPHLPPSMHYKLG